VDLVNEILEFRVAHGNFAGLSEEQKKELAKNTGDTTQKN